MIAGPSAVLVQAEPTKSTTKSETLTKQRNLIDIVQGRCSPPTAKRTVGESVPLDGPVETVIATVWADVLGLSSVSVVDNFFTLDGDSIRTIKIVSRLRREDYEADLESLFSHPTVRELARAVRPVAAAAKAAPNDLFGLLSAADHTLLTTKRNEI